MVGRMANEIRPQPRSLLELRGKYSATPHAMAESGRILVVAGTSRPVSPTSRPCPPPRPTRDLPPLARHAATWAHTVANDGDGSGRRPYRDTRTPAGPRGPTESAVVTACCARPAAGVVFAFEFPSGSHSAPRKRGAAPFDVAPGPSRGGFFVNPPGVARVCDRAGDRGALRVGARVDRSRASLVDDCSL